MPAGGAISHGGQDLELFGKYNLMSNDRMGFAIMGGAGFPDTPAQNRAIGTIGASGSFRALDRLTVYLNPRATLQEGNTIAGVGAGVDCRISCKLSITGDWTVIASGENTRDTSDGSRIKRSVWGAALRWSTTTDAGVVSLDLGYGNGTGSTTGFGVTPGLGHSAAFYVALSGRR
jgi:hypothetical protein